MIINKEKLLEYVCRWCKEEDILILGIITAQTNSELSLSEKQLTSVIVMLTLLRNKVSKPDDLDLLPISTYINSCH
jgi:hypothetical protein